MYVVWDRLREKIFLNPLSECVWELVMSFVITVSQYIHDLFVLVTQMQTWFEGASLLKYQVASPFYWHLANQSSLLISKLYWGARKPDMSIFQSLTCPVRISDPSLSQSELKHSILYIKLHQHFTRDLSIVNSTILIKFVNIFDSE